MGNCLEKEGPPGNLGGPGRGIWPRVGRRAEFECWIYFGAKLGVKKGFLPLGKDFLPGFKGILMGG